MEIINDANDMDSAQRTLRADAKRNHELLIASARSVFAELGPDAPLDEIARRAGVGIGTLYRHFPTRYDIQEAVMAVHVRSLIDVAERQMNEPDPAKALEHWLWHKVERSFEYHGVGAAVWLVMADKPTDYNELCSQLRAHSSALLERAQAAGAIRSDITYKQLLKMANAIVVATEKSENREEDIALLFRIMMDGLKLPSASQSRSSGAPE